MTIVLLTLACGSPSASPVDYCDVEPVIDQRCTTCHGNPRKNGAPIFLTTYEEVSSARGLIPHWVGDYRMPPENAPEVEGNELTEDERELILQWVDDGALACDD